MTHLCVSWCRRRLGFHLKFRGPIFRDTRAKSLILRGALSNPEVISKLTFLTISDQTGRVTQFSIIETSSAISERFRSNHSFQINSLVFVYVGVEAAQQQLLRFNSYQPKLPITMSATILT